MAKKTKSGGGKKTASGWKGNRPKTKPKVYK